MRTPLDLNERLLSYSIKEELNMEILTSIFWIALVLFVMVFFCFFTSGIANIPGSIFEKKSTPEERAAAEAAKAADERGTVRGGRKQSA
jgi:uncharacterized protein involved in cysteine biosynthesis